MEPYQALITQGGFGLMAGVFLWLFLQERKDHKETKKEKDAEIKAVMEARRVDAVENKDQAYEVLQGNSQSLQLIGAKIEAVQNTRKR